MDKLKPKDEEIEKALLATREQCKDWLRLRGYDNDSEIPINILNTSIKETFNNIDLESLMPQHFAELKKVRDEVFADWSVAMDNNAGMSDRALARSKVETRINDDPWIKNLLVDYDSAVKFERDKIKEHFKARVKLGKKKSMQKDDKEKGK